GRPDAPDPQATRGRLRCAALPWRILAALAALVVAAIVLLDGPRRDPGAMDRSLLGNHPHWVQAVAFAADGRPPAACNPPAGIALWDVATGRHIDALSRPGDPVVAVAFAPQGWTIAVGTIRGRIELWDLTVGRRRSAWQGHEGEVQALAFAPDGRA